MLCHLSSTSFAILPPSQDILTFVDASSNIERVACEAEDEDGGLLGYGSYQDRVLVWSRRTRELKVRKSSDGKETKLGRIENMSALARFGEKAYLAYCEKPECAEIVLIDGDKLEGRTVLFTHARKTCESSEAGPAAYAWTEEWMCAVFTRKDSLFVCKHKRTSSSQPPKVYTLHNKDVITSLAVTLGAAGALTICAGSAIGKIAVHRSTETESKHSTTTAELHWHSGPVNALCLIDENHLVSGGDEGVIVMWRLDKGTSSMTFRPRLGAPIIAGSALPMTTNDDASPPGCLLLLSDGCVLDVEVPTLVLTRRIRAWIPSNAITVTSCGGNDDSRFLAVALDNHRPGALTFVDADLRNSTSEERVLDVAARNAVSTADKEFRWRTDEVRFSPNGKTFAAILSAAEAGSGGRRRELRVFHREIEVLRVPLALRDPRLPREGCKRGVMLAVTNESVAVADPNAVGKVVVFKSSAEEDFNIQRVFDVEPQKCLAVALSDDESCIACLMKTGLVRVWNRTSGEIVLSHSVSAEEGGGIAFTKGSREIFVWNANGIDAIMQRRTLRLPQGTACVSACIAGDSLVMLKRGEEGQVAMCKWTGADEDEQIVPEVEASKEWTSVQWGGAQIGWILQRQNGSIQTRGGRNTVVPKRREAKGATLPGLHLRRDKAEKSKRVFKASSFSAAGAAASFGTDWCKDLPSHLLQSPPSLQIVWPKWETKTRERLVPTTTQQNGGTVVALIANKKRQRMVNETNNTDASVASGSGLLVDAETEDERHLMETAFRSSNGVAANGDV